MRERALTGKVATIGVDVGGTSISGGLVRDDGEVLATVETPTHVSGLGTAVKTLLAVIHDVYSQARAQGWTVDGVDEACEALAATLATIVNGLDPELIVITGGVAESLVPLHADVMRRTAAYAFAHPLGSMRIQITRSDKRDTVRGGAALFAYERARRAGSR